MVMGITDYENTNLGVHITSAGNNQAFAGALELISPVSSFSSGYIYNNSAFTVAKTKSDAEDDRLSGQLAASTEFHYNNDGISTFVDAYVGTELSCNNSYNQTTEYGADIGFYQGFKSNGNGGITPAVKFGAYPTAERSERTNRNFTVDAALTAGLAAGTHLRDAETAVYAYARGAQEITNRKNLHTEFGVGISKPITLWDAEVNLNAEVGYGKNWSGHTTNNFVRKNDGLAFKIGASLEF